MGGEIDFNFDEHKKNSSQSWSALSLMLFLVVSIKDKVGAWVGYRGRRIAAVPISRTEANTKTNKETCFVLSELKRSTASC